MLSLPGGIRVPARRRRGEPSQVGLRQAMGLTSGQDQIYIPPIRREIPVHMARSGDIGECNSGVGWGSHPHEQLVIPDAETLGAIES